MASIAGSRAASTARTMATARTAAATRSTEAQPERSPGRLHALLFAEQAAAKEAVTLGFSEAGADFEIEGVCLMTDIQDPCPKWCVTEPESDGGYHIHRTGRVEVDRYKSGHGASVSTRGGGFGIEEDPRKIVVHGWHMAPESDSVSGDLYVPLKDAPELAGVFEALSYVTPGQIRELAAGMRQAHAEMTEPEAGA